MTLPSSGNGLTIDDGSADIEFYDGYGTWGFRLAAFSPLNETRGDGFAGQIASGGQNYDDATPFKRKVHDNWLGGMGQTSDNKTNGGVGIGGDDTKYFYADAKTDRAGYLLPGMARNLIYNTVANQTLGVTGDTRPNAGDEYEVPRGVLPVPVDGGYYMHNAFSVSSLDIVGVTKLKVLFNLTDYNYDSSAIISLDVMNGLGATVATFAYAFSGFPDPNSFNGWNWLTLTSSAVTFSQGTTYDIYIYQSNPGARSPGSIGCYVGLPTNTTQFNPYVNKHALRPYFQICKPGTATSYKEWQGGLQKVHQLLDTSTGNYFDVAVMNNYYFNTSATGTTGTNTNSPERLLTPGSSSYKSSIVHNNQLYTSYDDGNTTFGVRMTTAAQAKINADITGTNTDTTFVMLSPVIWGGKFYFVHRGGLGLYRWTGNFPASGADAPVNITSNSTCIAGEGGVGINKLFVFQGNLWVVKPEGVFMLYGVPSDWVINTTIQPKVLPMGDPFPTPHATAGKYTVVHQGSIYVNYKDKIYQYTVSATNGVQVQVTPLAMPWYRQGYYNQIDGMASDGVNLYVSFNNLGVFSYINQTWHPVSEIYATKNAITTYSGLSWVVNPSIGCDSLYFGDGNYLIKMPIPSAGSPYTQQMLAKDQNKCGYLITSGTNMEAADMTKFIMSVTASAAFANYCIMVRPTVYATSVGFTTPPSFNNVLTMAFHQGLIRDAWTYPSWSVYSNNHGQTNPNLRDIYVATQRLSGGGALDTLKANTVGPTFWTPQDSLSTDFSSEKPTYVVDNTLTHPYDDMLQHPARFVQVAFIIYFWNPVPGQPTTPDLMAIDSLVEKYQTIQNYLALYKLQLSLSDLTEGRSLNLTNTDAEDCWEWVRLQLGRHSPLQVRVKVREAVDPSPPSDLTGGVPNQVIPNSKTRTFFAFLQNPNQDYTNPIINLDTNQGLGTTCTLELISAIGENPYV